MVIPLVIVHREQQVVARVGQQPDIVRLRSPLDVANGRQDQTRVGDDAAPRFKQYGDALKQMLCLSFAGRFACDLECCREHFRWFEVSAEHVAFVFGQLLRHRAVAQVVDGNSAAEIDVFERVPRLAVQREEMLPHGFESLGERFYVRSLRADVDVYAADVDEFGMKQPAPEGFEDFRVGDAELRGQQRGLQAQMRARADLRREAQGDFGALADSLSSLFDKLDFVNRINVDGIDSGTDGFVQFRVRLTRAVEDDLFGTKPDASG